MSLENKESVAPVDAAEDENDTTIGSSPHRKRNIIIAASIAAILLLAGAGGGYAYACNNVNAGVDAAAAWNKETLAALDKTVKDATALLESTGEDKVADTTVLDDLTAAVDKAKQAKTPTVTANSMLVWELLDAQNTYDQSADSILTLDRTLHAAMDKVDASVTEKTLTDAKDALSTTIDSAQSTLDGSDGKVQDNATRDALSKALDAAKKALDGDDAEAMATAKSDLEAKANAVNDSVKAKEQADAEAQAQADAASAAASDNSGYTGGGYTGYTGGGNSSSSSGGYTGGSYTGGGNNVDKDGDGFNDIVPWLPTDSMGNHAHYTNSDCAIYYPDGNVKDVPCS